MRRTCIGGGSISILDSTRLISIRPDKRAHMAHFHPATIIVEPIPATANLPAHVLSNSFTDNVPNGHAR